MPLPSNLFRRLKRPVLISRKLLDAPTVPFVSTHDLTAVSRLPPDFAVSRYRGLALCHVVSHGPAGNKLVAYWNSEQHWVAQAPVFEADLGLPPAAQKGLLVQTKVPKESWWKTIPLRAAIVALAALFAALATLRSNLAEMLDPPDVQVSFVDLKRIDAISAQSFSASVKMQNNSIYAPTRVKTIEGTATPAIGGSGFPLKADLPGALLSAGQSHEISLSGAAPKHQTPNGPPEVYDLKVTIGVRTGELRGDGTAVTTVLKQLLVWPSKIGWDSTGTVREGAGKDGPADYAQVVVTLYTGQSYPQGVSGLITLTSLPGEISSMQVVNDQENIKIPLSPPGPTVTRQVPFHTKALQPFQRYPLQINLESPRKLEKQRWDALLGTLKPYAE